MPPFVLRLLAVMAVIGLAGCAQTQSSLPTRPVLRRDVSMVKLDPAAATAMLTRYRESRGLTAVRLDPQLVAMARVQADAMAAQGVLSHEAAGPFASRLGRAGLQTTSAAENIAAGYDSLDSTFASWQRSPAHNDNLLRPGMTRFGIALAKAPATRYQTYWAMVVAGDPPPPPPPGMAEGPRVQKVAPSLSAIGGALQSAVSTPLSYLTGR